MMAQANGFDAEEAEDLSSSPFRVQQLLTVRAVALTIVGSCKLAAAKEYVARFMRQYTNAPAEGFQRPSLAEAESVDRDIWREICYVARTEKWSFQDALQEVAVTRDSISRLLICKPKPPKAPPKRPFDGDDKYGDKRRRATSPRPKGKGKGDVAKQKGTCYGFQEGTCDKGSKCRYKHACSNCGGDHPRSKCKKE